MSMGRVSHLELGNKERVKGVHILDRLGVRLQNSQKIGFVVHHDSEWSLVVE